MKIKKEFLNEKSLKPYGFEKDVEHDIDGTRYEYYVYRGEYTTIIIYEFDRKVFVKVNKNYTIPNAIYNLIKDGIAEPDEPEKMTLAQVCKLLGKDIEIIP